MKSLNQLCNGFTRREALTVGGLSALGLGLHHRAAAAESATAKSCILIWLDGGPSHLETFDLKPDAPSEVRGPLKAIPTSVPGIFLSECLPETARRMDDLAIIRSMTSPLGEHNFGTHYLMTGYRPTPALEYPTFGAVAAHLGGRDGVLPANVAVPDFRVGGARLSGGAFLPPAAHPFSLTSDPARRDFRVRDLEPYPGLTSTRLQRRSDFVSRLDAMHRQQQAATDTGSGMLARAVELVTAPEALQAFRLEDESRETRARYGLKTVGQSCLLARRLVERGVSFVTVNHRGWDTHSDMYTRLKEGYVGARVAQGLIPSLDLALSALLDDLRDRGLLDDTLVLVMGEFGRTPKLNTNGGRDHWPRVFSVAAAGGGVRGGQVIGASDLVGESPADHPVTPSDLVRTIYALLGLDPDDELTTPDGRPIRLALPESQLVRELLS